MARLVAVAELPLPARTSSLFLCPPPPVSLSPLVSHNSFVHDLLDPFTNLLIGQLLRGATDDQGKLKSAALLVGIKLDLEAEVHLTARVKGDICVGLY